MVKKTPHKQEKDDVAKEPQAASDDVVFESEEGGDTDTIKKLRDRLKTCLSEKQEYLDGWQRARADFLNLKKETAAEKERFAKFATEDIIHELLVVVDSFDMAFGNTEVWEKVDKNWRTGVEHIYAQFMEILEHHGVKPIDPKGEMFNPEEHASLEVIKTDKKEEDNMVAEVVQKGYRLRDKVIRAARVKIKQYSE